MFIMACLLALAGTAHAQETLANSVAIKEKTTEPTSVHDPQKALFLSLLPGAGQVYNGQAWKLPIIYGAFGASGYFVYDNYTNMRKFKAEYLHRIEGGEPELQGYTDYPNSSIYNLYQTYNKNFQLMVIVTGLIYGLNLIDAYVFGHLYDFQISDDLTLNVSPTVINSQFSILNSQFSLAPAITCSFTF